MCGLPAAFLPLYNKTDLYHAGGMCGKNSAVVRRDQPPSCFSLLGNRHFRVSFFFKKKKK
eukprot:SAG11_NODE_5347_length_1588_cov_2.326394_1_plen_59_part_10